VNIIGLGLEHNWIKIMTLNTLELGYYSVHSSPVIIRWRPPDPHYWFYSVTFLVLLSALLWRFDFNFDQSIHKVTTRLWMQSFLSLFVLGLAGTNTRFVLVTFTFSLWSYSLKSHW
jgi:hypothetical protein